MTKILNPKTVRSRLLRSLDGYLSPKVAAVLTKDVVDALRDARDRVKLPLTEVLDKIPGETVVARCEAIGIARQTYYQWLRGVARPNSEQAEKLAKLTGHSVDQIRGRTSHGEENENHRAQAAG